MKAGLIKIAFSFLLTLSFRAVPILFGQEAPIVVSLDTEMQRLPIYLAGFGCAGSTLERSYCEKLESVLQFDFDHNAMTYVLPISQEREKLVNTSSLDRTIKSADWKALKALYVIKVQIQGQKLAARLLTANSDAIRSIDDIPLSGNLSEDRRQMHQLADILFKTMFGKEGIASTRFLYTVKTKQGKNSWSSEVFEADYDGENVRQVTFDSGYSITPVYIPPKPGNASGSFFFVSYKTGQPKIYYQSLNGTSSPYRVTSLRGNQLMPAISSQRDKLAFISDVTGNPDLFMQPFNPDTGPIDKPYQAFAAHLATQGSPTFSPDGSKIAFVSNKDGAPRIYMMDVPGPGTSLKEIKTTLITKHNKESTAPAWSPDGTKIAYCAITKGVRQIWVYDLLKREERQLTQGSGNKENPTWAPNSLHLIFNSSDANACELYLINLNQTDAIQISKGFGEKRFPCWEPRN